MALVSMTLSDLNADFKVTLYSTSNNYRAIITKAEADQQKVVHDLSNLSIFDDLQRPHISRSGHSLTLNVSEMATDGEETKLSNGTSINDLE